MPTCPACSHDIPPDDVNIAEGVALCRPCDQLHRLSTLAGSEASSQDSDARHRIDDDTPVPEGPPDAVPGTSYRDDGLFTTITASPRNFKHALIGMLMSVFWNGIISFGLFAAWTRILVALGVALPWAPGGAAPSGSGFIADALKMPLGLAVFINVFMIPFLLVGLAMVTATLYAIAGRLEVVVTDVEAWVWQGVLVWGRKKRFDPMTITRIGTKVEMKKGSSGDLYTEKKIVIGLPEKPIKFGSTLTDERRRFVEQALRYAVLTRRQRA